HKPISAQAIARAIIGMLKEKKGYDEPDGNEDTSAAGTASIEEASMEGKRKKHILIVDDDSRILRMLKTYLAGRYELATAINGKVALKFLETKTTDLVLLDYEMPTENGPAVLEKIRANERTKNLPVVFLTGVTKENKIREVLHLKIQGYLIKPVDMEKLLSTIKGILG
ncbi:MAG: response regulator, partial [Lachnospiraceae bacterium]|nr:response regulator [Lachnospiraceae bacterium]